MSENSKVEKSGDRKLPPNAGKGRKAGVPNKTTALLKDAILRAAQIAGGGGDDGIVNYLAVQAEDNPKAFIALLGKVLPMQVTGADGDPLKIEILTKEQRDAAVQAALRADE